MCIVLRATTESEKKFYGLLSSNAEVSIKELCKKIPRRMVYKYIKELQAMQQMIGSEIISRKAGICQRTSMPIVLLERKMEIRIEEFPGIAFVRFSERNCP